MAIDIDINHAFRCIKRVYPGLASLKVCGQGTDNIAFEANDEFIFRFPIHQLSAQKLENQAKLLDVISEVVNLPVPRYEIIGHDDMTGFGFASYRKINGEQLKKRDFFKLSEKSKERFFEDVSVFLSKLHSIPLQTGRCCGLEETNVLSDLEEDLFTLRKLVFPKLSKKSAEYVESFIEKYLEKSDNRNQEMAVLHGDLSEDHIIYDFQRDCIAGIIDFGDAFIFEPAYDIYWLWGALGNKFLRAMANNYPDFDYEKTKNKCRFWWDFLPINEMICSLTDEDPRAFEKAVARLETVATKRSKRQKNT